MATVEKLQMGDSTLAAKLTFTLGSILAVLVHAAAEPQVQIKIEADQVLHPVSRYLTGACIEDVNHEVYGGIDSQMIFGESFAEPPSHPPLKGLVAYGGRWIPEPDDGIRVEGGDAPKLLLEEARSATEASVEMRFGDRNSGNGALIVRVTQAGKGRDQFNGYEIGLDPSGRLVIGRHRQNWEPIRNFPCDVPTNQWVKLTVRMNGHRLETLVDGRQIFEYEDSEHPLEGGTIGLRAWQREVRFRNFVVTDGSPARKVAFELRTSSWADGVSGMWRPIKRGSATGHFALNKRDPFSGGQSQDIVFANGAGEIGIENQSLNHWGMNLLKGEHYEGYVWIRSGKPGELFVALESRDGDKVHAEKQLKFSAGDWRRLDFALEPRESDSSGRFAIKLKQPGAVTVGYAFLQPGNWGRFKGLPVRKDVAEALIDQGVKVLRYGGSMVNAREYRWKKMIGPRARRSPYAGSWYPHASNGWGVFDFLNFCEAAGFLAVPDLNANETPQDMADFIEYVNGPAQSDWGRKRAADRHPEPYHLKYLEIGNEEQVNEAYWDRFKAIAEAIWAKDPSIILVVGDFAYNQPIKDPFNFTGADGRITSLSAHQKILQLAKQHGREVWFDVHVWTDGPRPNGSLAGMFSFVDALDHIAAGAKHKVVVFELNANNHAQRRALANALALNAVYRDGRLPAVTSANCLQPDGQNDNGWDQGLLFLNPTKVWSQPPGCVMQMASRNYQPLLVKSAVRNASANLDVTATRSENGNELVLQVVNIGEASTVARIEVSGFKPTQRMARVEELSGSLNAFNTAAAIKLVEPNCFEWEHRFHDGQAAYQFAPHSFTVIRWR